MASGSRVVMDKGLLEKFVPVFILSQKKVMKLKKLEILRCQGVTIHSCTECNYQCHSQYKGCLTVHSRTHNGVKPFECEQCDQNFSQKGYLIAHMLTHQAIKKLKCDTCNYKCNTNQKQCDQCDFSCIRKCNLVEHLKRMHTGEKPYSCTICEFKARIASQVTLHMRVHTGVKPFSCIQCTFNSDRQTHLTVHIRTHTGERPFQCEHCSYRASEKSNLTRHLKTCKKALK